MPERERFVAGYRDLGRALARALSEGAARAGDRTDAGRRLPAAEFARARAQNRITSVRDAQHAAGDAKVDTLELWFDPAEGLGCDFIRTSRPTRASAASWRS